MVKYPAEEWEQRRELITRLYSREGKTLKEVKRILADQAFPASERMFKQRIHAWELDKNNKEHEMIKVLRIVQTRKSIGKDTVCHIRGKIVNIAEIRRYFSRKGITCIDGVDLDDETPPTIRVSTPVDQLLATPETPRSQVLALPDSFQCLQIVNNQIKNYIYGTYESCWQPKLPQYDSESNSTFEILEWRTHLFDAMDLFEVGNANAGYTLLNKVCDRITTILREQHPSLLGEILELASTYRLPSQFPFREQVLHFLSSMSSIILGPNHPLTLLLHHLLNPTLRHSLIESSMRTALTLFSSPSTFGPSHEQTLTLHTRSACLSWESSLYDRAAATYRHVTSMRTRKTATPSHPLSCWADIAEAEALLSSAANSNPDAGEIYDQAQTILEEVCRRQRYIQTSDHVAQVMYAMRALAGIHIRKGNSEMAAWLRRRCVLLSARYLEIDRVYVGDAEEVVGSPD